MSLTRAKVHFATALIATVLMPAVLPDTAVPAAAQEPLATIRPDRVDLALEMPQNIGGFEPEVVMTYGAEHLANLDTDDPVDRAKAAELDRLFEETGVTVADMTSGYALVSQEDFFAFVVAVRLEGAMPGSALPAYMPILTAGLTDLQTAPAKIGGKDVLVVTSVGDGGDPVDLYVYDAGDTIWMVQGPVDVVGFVLEDLPSPASSG